MIDLGENWHSVFVDCRGDLAVARNYVTMKAVDEFFVRPVGWVGAVFLGDDEASTTCSACFVICSVLISWLAIARIVGEVRREDNPVACSYRPELERGPQILVRHA